MNGEQLPRGPLVYLLHFERPFGHAQHYVGFANDLAARLRHHETGNGARLTAAVAAAGITWIVARVWLGADRTFERRLHKRKGARHICPTCSGDSALRRGRAS